jgi:hypothetical protein
MDAHVRVELGDEGPVVVKAASGAGAVALRYERDRLRRAVHPGVVALAEDPDAGGDASVDAGAGPDNADGGGADAAGADVDGGAFESADAGTGDAVEELRTVYAGDPLARWTGSIEGIAGVGAAVASTLADLHELGVVHGRIDDGHILVGDDGRPRLCGLSGPGDATAADDVAALGAVLGGLLVRAAADGRRPVRARRRGLGRRQRVATARRTLGQVVERATDPVPSRRPAARALADAILRAVPGAELPGAASPSPRAATSGARRRPPDTLERIWAAVADERSDDERWAAAFGSGPPDLDRPSERPPTVADAPEPRMPGQMPVAALATPAWSDTPPGPTRSLPTAPDRRLLEDTGEHACSLRADTAFAAHRDACPDTDPDAYPAADPNAHTDAIDAPAADTAGTPPPPPGSRAPVRSGRGVDDLTRGHRPVGLRVGPAPRRPTNAAPARTLRHGRTLVTAGVCGLAVVAALAVVATGLPDRVGSGGDADTSRSDRPGVTATGCPAIAPPAADVDGDGCREPLAVRHGAVDAGVARWTLGEPGDLAAVGDWDCDGDASAALLRPSTGDVFVFAAWAEVDEPVTVPPVRRVPGASGIRSEAAYGGCDRLVVEITGGGRTLVEVAG